MGVYYNEIDPRAAAWLRQLMADGLIPQGVVDERSITEVVPADLEGYTQHHFFAGIGGWSRALQLAGWPNDRPVWSGSCPCQPFSNAGKRRGYSDVRHLWPEFFRLIKKCRPTAILGEQVASKAGRTWLSGVRSDLETLGYGVGAADLCAAGVGAPHIRQRLWWVADVHFGDAEEEQARDDAVGGQRPSVGGRPVELPGAGAGGGDSGGDTAPGAGGSRDGGHQAHPGNRGGGLEIPEPGERDNLGQARRQGGQPMDAGPEGLRQGYGEAVRGRLGPGGAAVGVAEPAGGRLEGSGGSRKPGYPPIDAPPSGAGGGMADPEDDNRGSGERPQEAGIGEDGERRRRPSGDGAPSWNGSTMWHKGIDGRVRRIPTQSVLRGVDDGVPEGLDLRGAEGCYPLAPKIKGRVAILKGYGNAIVPQVGAEFVKAYMEAARQISG